MREHFIALLRDLRRLPSHTLSSDPVRCYIPGRPRRVTAEPEVVVTRSRLSGITESIIRHDPVAMASTAVGVVGL